MIMKRAADYRLCAREKLNGKRGTAAMATFILFLCTIPLAIVSYYVDGLDGTRQAIWRMTFEDGLVYVGEMISPAWWVVLLSLLLSLISAIVSGASDLGSADFYLAVSSDETPPWQRVLSGFSDLWKALRLDIARSFFIFLWSLLFVIPGLIKAYSYAMTHYVMQEHPEMTAREALKASEELMRGNRWRLFCLEFSFIGWAFLTALTACILGLYTVPYFWSARTEFYLDISGRRQA